MAQYNPQVAIELTLLNEDGSESRINDNFTQLNDIDFNYHDLNKPIDFNATISKRLGSDQDSCNITIQNPQFLEQLRLNPRPFIESIKNKFYRVRVWAWHDDNNQTARLQRPNIPPVWVGDILDGFTSESSSVNDSSITIESLSHSWLATSGKMRNTWPIGTTYDVIVNDIFDWFLNERGYGRENFGSTPKKVLNGQANLASKSLVRAFSINRNPVETVNDICRDFDMVFGFHCNIPYILPRDSFFIQNELNDTPLNENGHAITRETGKRGLSNYSTFSFSASSTFNEYQIIGTFADVDDQPQINGLPTVGRIDSCDISLSNGIDGHFNEMSLSYLGNDGIILPRRRNNSSGSDIL